MFFHLAGPTLAAPFLTPALTLSINLANTVHPTLGFP